MAYIKIEMTSEYVEEYLETLYTLTKNGRPAKTTEIASALKVMPASVTEMLKKLSEEGYIDYQPYYGATLTEKGLRVAKKVKRKHRLLERFLSDVLKIKENLHEQACKMEHALSNEAEEALCKLLNKPDKCPDDNKVIPPCDKDIPSCLECDEEIASIPRKRGLISLINLRNGEKGKIAFIRGGRGAVQRLTDMGLTTGTEIKVLESAPFHGPVEILVRGSKLAIGHGLATKIFVEAT
ncbi:MAG: DtxR family transcriptional regulator [Candidatus Hydrothermarchaeota archaeon]